MEDSLGSRDKTIDRRHGRTSGYSSSLGRSGSRRDCTFDGAPDPCEYVSPNGIAVRWIGPIEPDESALDRVAALLASMIGMGEGRWNH